MSIEAKCQPVEFILSDVDGVLTDGGIIFTNDGIELKRFHSLDGQGIKLWRRAGFAFGILTARVSHIVKLRAGELGVDVLRQGFEDKVPVARQLMADLSLKPEQVCYIGDDLPDLPVMRAVGFSVAVKNAVEELRTQADYITTQVGGQGAVREAIELILKSKGLWADLIQKYTG